MIPVAESVAGEDAGAAVAGEPGARGEPAAGGDWTAPEVGVVVATMGWGVRNWTAASAQSSAA
jgi:hypothetical protein